MLTLRTLTSRLTCWSTTKRALSALTLSEPPFSKRDIVRRALQLLFKRPLAAAILMMTPWEFPLLDPCCGIGTLLIEAAMIGSKITRVFPKKWGFHAPSH